MPEARDGLGRDHLFEIGLGKRPSMPCTICGAWFTEADVSLFQYFPTTQVCQACYAKLAESTEVCFGDAEQYDPASPDCFKYCPDRHVCRVWVEGDMGQKIRLSRKQRESAIAYLKTHKMQQAQAPRKRKKKEQHPFNKGSILRACFDKCVHGTTLKALRAYCDDLGTKFPMVYRRLRMEAAAGYIWTWIEDEDSNIRIDFEGNI